MWKRKRFTYISVEKAQQKIKEAAKLKPKHEMIPTEKGYRRILAETIKSEINIPSENVSHYDGYAVRAKDTLKATIDNPILLKLIPKIDGAPPKLRQYEAANVLTGHQMALNSDAVVPVEMAKSRGDFIEIRRSLQSLQHVIPAGIDIRKREKIFNIGHILRAQDIKLLMMIKKYDIKVFKKPKIALLSVGDELTNLISETDHAKFDSHKLMVSTMVTEAGGIPLDLGIAIDKKESIKRKLIKGLDKAEIVATIGGCSLGEKDLVWETLKSLKPTTKVRGIKIQPGRVSSLGIFDDKIMVMLPGHIQSTFTGFYFLLLPIIRLYSGLPIELSYSNITAKIQKEIEFRHFRPFKKLRFVKVTKKGTNYVAEVIQGDSSLINNIVKANGCIIIPERKTQIKKKEEVKIHLFPGLFPFNLY
jgi:molybdopterin molybdotransferase